MEEFKLTKGGFISFVAVSVAGYLLTLFAFQRLDTREYFVYIGIPVLVVTVVCTILLNKNETARKNSQASEILLGGLIMVGWLISAFVILGLLGAVTHLFDS
tara:strand:+ start:180 stop:485 length:306 start_codon:yes stop_codon:yes gene_type:complete